MPENTILIIDDSRFLVQAYSRTLRDAGYRVLTASDGQSGIAVARKENPNLIVLDILMPGLSGVDVLRSLKSTPSTSDIPILVISSLTERNADKLIQEGATAYCEKNSLTSENMEAAIDRILRSRWAVPRPSYAISL